MNPHNSNITTVQPLAIDTGMMPRADGQEPTIYKPALSPPTPDKYGQYSELQTGASSSTDRDFTVHTPSLSLSISTHHADRSVDFTCVVQRENSKLLQIASSLIFSNI